MFPKIFNKFKLIFKMILFNDINSKYFQKKYKTSILQNCVFYGSENIYFDKNVSIGINSFFSAEGGEIKVGENTSFNSGVHINAAVCGKIFIDKNCLIGPNVVMRTADHIFTNADVPIRLQGHKCQNIFLEEDVWIGANVVITGGVTISKGCVIGAGSVVTKNIPEYSIAVGVPARVIKSRK
jgi:acetyltransferase-like isoleucine patch superfamily enzyme